MGAFSLALLTLLLASIGGAEQQLMLALEDEFDDFDLSLWKHELTLGGGGNWEFQYYTNNRSNSFVENGTLHIRPTLMAEEIGEAAVRGGFTLNIWGTQPADHCTGNAFFGCERCAGCGGNVLNPIKSARIRTAESFSFTYGKVEVRAKLPRGDWLWPAIWMLDNPYGFQPTIRMADGLLAERSILWSRGVIHRHIHQEVTTRLGPLFTGDLIPPRTNIKGQPADDQVKKTTALIFIPMVLYGTRHT